MQQSLILIGMPGSGKTTMAKMLVEANPKLTWIDTDHVLIDKIGPLAAYIQLHGRDKFQQEEEVVIASLNIQGPTIISTGGSVVYSATAMRYLKSLGPIVWLKVSYETLTERDLNLGSRGVIGQGSFLDIYQERQPLYDKYGDAVIESTTPQETLKLLQQYLC
jgi:shikimate kinase